MLAAALVALAATACGSSTPSEPSASASKADITSEYKTLFNFSSKNVTAMAGAIQDGSAVKASLSTAVHSAIASAATGASVLAVTLISDSKCSSKKVPTPCASVSYDILGSGGSVELGPETGYATYATGKWLVAKVTICSLLDEFYAVEGNTGTPAGCASS